MSETIEVFDRAQVRRQRNRAASTIGTHDFLLREVSERLADRLDDVQRRFPFALDLGCHHGILRSVLRGRGGIERLVQCDTSLEMIRLARGNDGFALVADEEFLPFAPARFDLVMSVLSLHWVNDLPGCLLQLRHCLKPDGLLLLSFLGGESLRELRHCLVQAEIDQEGGAGPRVSPFVDIRDAGALLQRAGFALPVADLDTITVTYADAFALMNDLRGMGEANAVAARRRGASRRATVMRAAELYQQSFQQEEGRLPATFQVITLTAWAPHASQQQPLRPGSAQQRLADALNSREIGTGEPAPRGEPADDG